MCKRSMRQKSMRQRTMCKRSMRQKSMCKMGQRHNCIWGRAARLGRRRREEMVAQPLVIHRR